MHGKLGRKHSDLFATVVKSTLRSCAQYEGTAGRSQPVTPGTRTQATRDGGVKAYRGRNGVRQRSSSRGKILLWNGRTILCTLLERSSVGARLNVGRQIGIPAVFTLEIAPGGEQLPARLAWRNQDRIEIEFLEVV
jgi:hypothetical protein